MKKFLTAVFWTLALMICLQFLGLGWSRDKGVEVVRICLVVLSLLTLPAVLFAGQSWLKIFLTVLAGWLAYVILAPSISGVCL